MSIIDAVKQISIEQAEVWARRYFGSEPSGVPYSGAYFNRIGSEELAPDRFTASDLYSLQCLAVNVPVLPGIVFLETHAETVNSMLAQIPHDLRLEDVSSTEYSNLLGPDSDAWALYRLLRADPKPLKQLNDPALTGRWNMGPTRVSKLMARKRPHLIPIEDSVVNRVIGTDAKDTWKEWWHALTTDPEPLTSMAGTVRHAAKTPELSTLRALDIVLWMKGKHDWNCEDGASCREAHVPDGM